MAMLGAALILVRWAAPRVLAGIGLALLLVGGLVGLATGVEQADQGASAALLAGLQVVPITLVWLAPLCCGVGAALFMARLMVHGEDLGLEAAGLGPRHTGWVAAGVGLCMGCGTWVVSEAVVPGVWLPNGPEVWVWLGDGAYRPSDGTRVRTKDGRILAVQRADHPDPKALQLARQRARPRLAPSAALGQAPGAQVERHGRLGRIVACVAMAVLGWIPCVRRRSLHLVLVLGIGLGAALLELGLHALAGQAQISPWLGAWAVPVLLSCSALGLLRR
jgi:lipopolysaccharide export LptBFGC system permease protein LptF